MQRKTFERRFGEWGDRYHGSLAEEAEAYHRGSTRIKPDSRKLAGSNAL
jgi:hypothetical protein